MAETAVIEIPMMPPQELGPNWHGHWRGRHAAAQVFREHSYLCALAWAGATEHEWAMRGANAVVMDIAVAWSGRRKTMDSDNLVAACKPARDGIADALFAGQDQHIQIGTVRQRRGNGVTTITLRALATERPAQDVPAGSEEIGE